MFSRDILHPLGLMCLFFLCLAVLLSSCLPTPTSTLPTISPTPEVIFDTPTPTFVWFPPTPTFTPYPLPTAPDPTPDQRPGIGEVIFVDDFSDPDAWILESTESGSVALGKNELTIAIQDAKAYLYSIRNEPYLDDFYTEITASPTLCEDKDEFGMLLRVTPNLDYYRFSLSCDGYVRLDRLSGGQASSPQPWLQSGAYPPGAPKYHQRLGSTPGFTSDWGKSRGSNVFTGDNTDFSMNFVPKMNPEGLARGYRRILATIYSPKEYYQRVFDFLRAHDPLRRRGSSIQMVHVRALLKSMVLLGVLGKERLYYWMLFFWSVFRRPRPFSTAITLAIYGFHFRRVFEQYL